MFSECCQRTQGSIMYLQRQRAKGKGQRAKGKGQRAKGKGLTFAAHTKVRLIKVRPAAPLLGSPQAPATTAPGVKRPIFVVETTTWTFWKGQSALFPMPHTHCSAAQRLGPQKAASEIPVCVRGALRVCVGVRVPHAPSAVQGGHIGTSRGAFTESKLAIRLKID